MESKDNRIIVKGGQSELKEFTEEDFDYRTYMEGGYEYETFKKSCIDKDKLDRILLKSPFEDEAEAIFSAVLKIHTGNISTQEKNRKAALHQIQENIKLAEALLMVMYDKNVSLVGSRKTILSNDIKRIMQEALMKQYKWNWLDFSPMTIEEGYKHLEEGDSDWDTIITQSLVVEDDLQEENESYQYHWTKEDVDEDLMKFLITGETLQRQITKKQILNKIQELKNEESKYKTTGRPIENIKLYAGVLAFMQAKGYKDDSNTFRIIFEYLDAFGFVPEEVKKGWENKVKIKGKYYYPEVSFIKSYCQKAKNFKLIFGIEIKDLPFPLNY